MREQDVTFWVASSRHLRAHSGRKSARFWAVTDQMLEATTAMVVTFIVELDR